MKNITFKNYLKELCFRINPAIIEVDMPEFFERFLEDFDKEDLIKCAEMYGKEMYLAGEEKMLNNMTKEEIKEITGEDPADMFGEGGFEEIQEENNELIK